MHQITLEEAATKPPELIREASTGEEVVLMQDNAPVAKLIPFLQARRRREPGSAKGLILHIAEDFDATPEEFAEYMS